MNDSRVTVRQLGNNVAAVNVSAPSDSAEMAQLIEMLTDAAATAPRGNNRMMMLQPNDLRRVLMNAAGGRAKPLPQTAL